MFVVFELLFSHLLAWVVIRLVTHGSTNYFYSGVRLASDVSAAVKNTDVVGVSGESVFELSDANFQWERFPGTLK